MQITDDDAFAFASSTRDFDARRDATTRAPIGRVDETRVRVDETRARGCDADVTNDCTRLKRLHFFASSPERRRTTTATTREALSLLYKY
jgi:hypothetical protein